jgi:hypothetical protein
MIFTVDSWMDMELEKELIVNNMMKQLCQQQVSVCGGYVCALVLLVAAMN